nr:MBL fold metallo-hydrolase [Actinomycetota bacterium]
MAKRELGRGERVLPGVWRLRLPLPWPGVPHCNAWALAAGDGIVLVDTGMHEPGSLAHLELALSQVRLRLELVRLVACTHAHTDHYGQAATVMERSGAQLWMHPDHEHMTRSAKDPEAAWQRRVEVARQSGVPEEPLRRYAESRKGQGFGVAAIVEPDRELVEGVTIETDLGVWEVHETPGHAPSHVCLFQPDRRVLISGDHLLGRVSPYYDYGWTPDPAGEFLDSLDKVDRLGARLCLSGHGKPFTDVGGH